MKGNSGTRNNSWRSKIDTFANNAQQFKTPFPLPQNVNEANEIARFQYRLGKYSEIGTLTDKDYEEKEIRLSLLSNSQEDVGVDKIESMMKSGISVDDMLDNGSRPKVLKYGSTYILVDGHHRATYAYLKGRKKIKVHLIDLEKLKL